jgi:hypothetical protein
MEYKMSFVRKILGDITGANQAARGAEQAAQTQAASADKGIEEQRRQFDALVQLMSPYVQAGTGALSQQQALIGLQGAEAQQQAMQGFEQSPLFQSLTQQGENAILQSASATGGLRGGNVQAALAQFRPQMLNQLIEQQYGRLGGLTTVGQASAAGQASSGMQSASNISNLLANQGAALAGGQLARGNVGRQIFGDVLNIAKTGAQIASAGAGGGGGQGGGGAQFSDRRLKKNIKQIGTRSDGLGVYEFDYIWGGARQIGLMAQEVQSVYPGAVSESGGYLMVDYSKV